MRHGITSAPWTWSTLLCGVSAFAIGTPDRRGVLSEGEPPLDNWMTHTGKLQARRRRHVAQRALFGKSISFIARLLICLACALRASPETRAAVAYVQGNNITATTRSFTAASVTYSSAQQAGDLNIVQIADYCLTCGTLISVTDSAGNSYSVAGNSGNVKLLVFYAANIHPAGAGANSVTVTFSYTCNNCASLTPSVTTGPTLIVNIAEYSGIATSNPLDVSVAAGGTVTAVSSGQVSTTNGNDLLLGAYFSTYYAGTATPGTGYTARGGSGGEVFIEDQTVASLGSYSATALSNGLSGWIMQLLAFRAQSTESICD